MQPVGDSLRLNVPASIFGVSNMPSVCVSGSWWVMIWCVRVLCVPEAELQNQSFTVVFFS